jgi:vacuolar-type H+-ATPase catalytic subunit A/Vma1
MKTLRELFERETKINPYKNMDLYYEMYAEWLEKGVEKQYAIRDKIIKELMKENKELKKEIDHVKDVWIGISDAKDLIIKRLEKENKELRRLLRIVLNEEEQSGFVEDETVKEIQKAIR